MKGLAWYSTVVYALFIIVCLIMAVMLLLPLKGQGMLLSIVLLAYIALTAISLAFVIRYLRKQDHARKGRAIFCLIWTCFVIVLPLKLLISSSSYNTSVFFTILSAGYEWNFIAIALLFMVLFIPVLVFWIKYLRRTGRAAA